MQCMDTVKQDTHRLLPGEDHLSLFSAEEMLAPFPRICHIAWAYQGSMWVFGGRGIIRPGEGAFFSKSPGKRSVSAALTNDLWCFNMRLRSWLEVRATGIVPSPRADMGKR